MQKMMTYSEANSVLGSSLTPANRCLSKAVAIANDADPDLLANFDNARLVPANVIEPATHWIDEHTIEHYFVDEDGNKIGDGKSISITIPTHGEFIIIRTKALLDGQPFPDDLKGGMPRAGDDTPNPSLNYYGWVHNEGLISKIGIHIHATFDVFHNRWPNPSAEGEGRDAFGLVNPTSEYGFILTAKPYENGITEYVLHCPLDYDRVNDEGNFHLHIIMNDWFADPNKLNLPDVVNTWNINAIVNRRRLSYDINRGLIDFKKAEIGQESTETYLTGFGDNHNDYEIVYIGYYTAAENKLIKDSAGKISTIRKSESGTSFIVTRTGDCIVDGYYDRRMSTRNLYKIYKKSDLSVFVYFVASFDPIPE